MHRERAISLHKPPPLPSAEYRVTQHFDCHGYLENYETRKRDGNLLTVSRVIDSFNDEGVRIRKETSLSRDCHVDYAALQDAVEIITDEHNSSNPWDDDEWYAHNLRLIGDHNDARQSKAAVREYGDGRWYLVELNEDAFGAKEDLEYIRASGASRQVAAEVVAQRRRRVIKQIVKWRVQGWANYGARLQFETGIDKYKDSIWGYYSEDDAKDGVEQVLDNVIHEMESAGYIVTGKPNLQAAKRVANRQRYRRNLAMFDWSD